VSPRVRIVPLKALSGFYYRLELIKTLSWYGRSLICYSGGPFLSAPVRTIKKLEQATDRTR
jgi:hypothetical protein